MSHIKTGSEAYQHGSLPVRDLAFQQGSCSPGLRDLPAKHIKAIEYVCGRVRSLLDKKALVVVDEVRDPSTGKFQEVLALPAVQLELAQ